MLRRPFFLRPRFRRQRVERNVFGLELRIAGDPGEHLSVLRADGVQDLTPERPTPFVLAGVERQDADPPFFHQCGREGGMSPNIARGGRWHHRNVRDEFLIERGELPRLLVVALRERHVADGRDALLVESCCRTCRRARR